MSWKQLVAEEGERKREREEERTEVGAALICLFSSPSAVSLCYSFTYFFLLFFGIKAARLAFT